MPDLPGGYGISGEQTLLLKFFGANDRIVAAGDPQGQASITKQIVEEHHGGELRLTSVEDEGTTVVLDLPLYEPSQAEMGEGLPPARRHVGNDSDSEDVFDIRA